MSLPSYLQDEDDDEDDEFIPCMDEEDGDFSAVDDDESEADEDEIPPFLQGYLMADPTDQRTILFQENIDENGSFCLKSKDEIPKHWSLYRPLLPKPVNFFGWIGNPTNSIEFQIQVLEQEIVDSLDEKLLQAQHEKIKSEPEKEKETVATQASTNQDQKEPARQAKYPPQLTKQTPILMEAPTPGGDAKSVTYSITGTSFRESQAITFRGVFCPVTYNENLSSLFVICTTRVEDTGEEYGTTTAPSGGSGNAAASKRKRDEDDSDNEYARRSKVDFQELIDLHEDAMRHREKRP